MKEKLTKLLNNSYVPYSNFHVGCIAVMNDGKEISGVNVENAAYGSTICAERSAIVSSISSGYKKGDFDKLYVMSSSGELTTPCFACRQVFVELLNSNTKIICIYNDGEKEFTVADLCPYAFTSEDLK